MSETREAWVKRKVNPFQKHSTEEQDYSLFMRDEIRPIIMDDRCFYSHADGIILYNEVIDSPDEKVEIKGIKYSIKDVMGGESPFDGPSLVCGIFMTFADIHLNRMPYTSILEYTLKDPIHSANVSMDYQEEEIFGKKSFGEITSKGAKNLYLNNNARMINRCYIPSLDYNYWMVQVADYDVSVIMPFNVRQKHQYFQGERFSFIRWGSQVDLILPLREDLDIKPLVSPGFHVEAGIDKIIKFHKY